MIWQSLRLKECCAYLQAYHQQHPDVNICDDSRQIQAGDGFVDLSHDLTQALTRIEQAIERGCAYVISAFLPSELALKPAMAHGVQFWTLFDELLAGYPALLEAALDFEWPEEIWGVTGTNGKTSVAYLSYQWMQALGYRWAYVGTLGMHIGEQSLQTGLTTPSLLCIAQALAKAPAGVPQGLILEVSSHALDQKRLAGLPINRALFTNLTQDHLDYHHDMENYFQAKLRLFTEFPIVSCILPKEDSYALRIAELVQAKEVPIRWYHEEALQQPPLAEYLHKQTLLALQAYNRLSALQFLLSFGVPLQRACAVWLQLQDPPGRLQKIPHMPCPTYLDFAHTPDALRRVMQELRQAYPEHRLRLVFGCGGQRDRQKRPLMYQQACALAHDIIITQDNSRHEAFESILADMLGNQAADAKVHIEPDRAKAIQQAVLKSASKDVLLVAGRGHETMLNLGEHHIIGSDAEWLEQARKIYDTTHTHTPC